MYIFYILYFTNSIKLRAQQHFMMKLLYRISLNICVHRFFSFENENNDEFIARASTRMLVCFVHRTNPFRFGRSFIRAVHTNEHTHTHSHTAHIYIVEYQVHQLTATIGLCVLLLLFGSKAIASFLKRYWFRAFIVYDSYKSYKTCHN